MSGAEPTVEVASSYLDKDRISIEISFDRPSRDKGINGIGQVRREAIVIK